MSKSEKKFYVISEDILPEAILKTAMAKEMLQRGEAQSIPDAAEKLGISRSTFYKYKDGIFSFFDSSSMNMLNISLYLRNDPGVLSGVLNRVAQLGGNVLTINQSLPNQGAALVTLAIGMSDSDVTPARLLESLESLRGVRSAEIIGKS